MNKLITEKELRRLCYRVRTRAGSILEAIRAERRLDPSIDEEGALLRALLWEIRWELDLPPEDSASSGKRSAGRSDQYWHEIDRLLACSRRVVQEELIDRVLGKKAS